MNSLYADCVSSSMAMPATTTSAPVLQEAKALINARYADQASAAVGVSGSPELVTTVVPPAASSRWSSDQSRPARAARRRARRWPGQQRAPPADIPAASVAATRLDYQMAVLIAKGRPPQSAPQRALPTPHSTAATSHPIPSPTCTTSTAPPILPPWPTRRCTTARRPRRSSKTSRCTAATSAAMSCRHPVAAWEAKLLVDKLQRQRFRRHPQPRAAGRFARSSAHDRDARPGRHRNDAQCRLAGRLQRQARQQSGHAGPGRRRCARERARCPAPHRMDLMPARRRPRWKATPGT